MTPKQAEEEICKIVKKMDSIRVNPQLSADDKNLQLSFLEANIIELKQITGPRKITGTFSR